jgi:hypothetical protein
MPLERSTVAVRPPYVLDGRPGDIESFITETHVVAVDSDTDSHPDWITAERRRSRSGGLFDRHLDSDMLKNSGAWQLVTKPPAMRVCRHK